MSRFNNLHNTIQEFDCDYCGKPVTWFGTKANYTFKKFYSDEGMLYFCSEKCKRLYADQHGKLVSERRKKRRNGKK